MSEKRKRTTEWNRGSCGSWSISKKAEAVHVPLYASEHVRVVMLCIAPGAGRPMHKHPGFEITITPLRGKGMITSPDGKEILLEPGKPSTLCMLNAGWIRIILSRSHSSCWCTG